MEQKKGLGLIFVGTAALGFLIGLVALFSVWYFRPRVIASILEFSLKMDESLSSVQNGLEIISQEVDLISTNMTSLLETTQALGDSLHASGPMLTSLSDLTSRDLPNTINSTQTALLSAQGSAQLIDNVLSALTSIPLINVVPYKPDIPLHTSLAQVSNSLNALKPSLISINASLALSKNNMVALEKEMSKITETTREMSTTFNGFQSVMDQYKASIQALSEQIRGLQSSAPGWVNTLAILITIGIFWFLLAQINLLAQGLFLLGRLFKDRSDSVV